MSISKNMEALLIASASFVLTDAVWSTPDSYHKQKEHTRKEKPYVYALFQLLDFLSQERLIFVRNKHFFHACGNSAYQVIAALFLEFYCLIAL